MVPAHRHRLAVWRLIFFHFYFARFFSLLLLGALHSPAFIDFTELSHALILASRDFFLSWLGWFCDEHWFWNLHIFAKSDRFSSNQTQRNEKKIPLFHFEFVRLDFWRQQKLMIGSYFGNCVQRLESPSWQRQLRRTRTVSQRAFKKISKYVIRIVMLSRTFNRNIKLPEW